MSGIAIPTVTASRATPTLGRRRPVNWLLTLILGLGVTVVALAVAWVVSRGLQGGGGRGVLGAGGGKFFAVAPIDMDVKVVKDGELQAVDNIDILCRVEG